MTAVAIRDLHAFIIDMDGVLWHGDAPLPGLAAFFATLRARGLRFVLATNNASKTPTQYIAKLAGMGVQVGREEILTSALAAAEYLQGSARPGAPVYAIGEDGLREALAGAGFALCAGGSQYVVVGMDRELTWDKLAQATLDIRAGAKFIGTNGDLTLPTERGFTHGNGAVLAALQAATGVAPVIMGKPEPLLYRQALARLGTDPARTAAVGDRLETDILGAVRAGLPSVLVLSGVSTRAQLEASAYRPTWVMDDIRALAGSLAV